MSENAARTPLLIDFEASSLSNSSYPIEVAFRTPSGEVESYLIRPEPGWTDWSDYAERHIHGISRAELEAGGRPAAWVAERMNAMLAGRVVLSDAPEFDERWLARLFEAAALAPAFEIGDFNAHLVYTQAPDPDGASARIERARALARERVPGQHRAAWDVAYLAELWTLAAPPQG